MRKVIPKPFNQRTSKAFFLLVIFAIATFFLVPVSDKRLVSSSWCGLDGTFVELSFSENGTMILTTMVVGEFDGYSYDISGSWNRDGWYQVQINTIESYGQKRYQNTYYLKPILWGGGLRTSGNFDHVTSSEWNFFFWQCDGWMS